MTSSDDRACLPGPIWPNLRRFVRIAAALCLLACMTSRVAAQRPSPEADFRRRAPMTAGTKATLFAAGLAGATLSFAFAGGLGWAASSGCGDEGSEGCIAVRGGAVGGVFGLAAIPLATAYAVSLTGRHRGHHDRFGRTYAGAFGGMALGGGVAFITMLAVGDHTSQQATLGVGMGVGMVAFAGVTTLAFWASDRRQARLTPSVAPTAGGLTLGLGGRF